MRERRSRGGVSVRCTLYVARERRVVVRACWPAVGGGGGRREKGKKECAKRPSTKLQVGISVEVEVELRLLELS